MGLAKTHISLLKEVAVNISEFCELVELELDLGSISFFLHPHEAVARWVHGIHSFTSEIKMLRALTGVDCGAATLPPLPFTAGTAALCMHLSARTLAIQQGTAGLCGAQAAPPPVADLNNLVIVTEGP